MVDCDRDRHRRFGVRFERGHISEHNNRKDQAQIESSRVLSKINRIVGRQDANNPPCVMEIDRNFGRNDGRMPEHWDEQEESANNPKPGDDRNKFCHTVHSNMTQLVKTKEEEVFSFYHLDAYENPYKNPGTVYLFGKTYVSSHDTYCSCCVMVHCIPRRIYLLPRKYIKNTESQLTTMDDVYKEFDEYTNKMRIMEFNCKEVKKHYSFEKEGTPKTSDYLEVRYNARYPAIDSNYSGPAIERVFGTTVNALELLLIERKIKGPCWLDIKNVSPTAERFAWCPQICNRWLHQTWTIYRYVPKRKLSPQ